MISYNLANKILGYALAHGGDYAEIFEEATERSRIGLLGSQTPSVLAGQEKGIGIRVLNGTKSRYLYTSAQEETTLFRMLKEALSDFGTGSPDGRAPLPLQPHVFSVGGARNAGLLEKLSLLRACAQAGMQAGPNMDFMQASCVETRQIVRILNTEGCHVQDERRKSRLFLKAFAKDGEETATSYVGPGGIGGIEFLESIDYKRAAAQAAQSAMRLLHARPCPTGRMPVILGNGFGGLFFHEACGHSLESSSLASGGSEFSGKRGRQVASEKVTLVDDGTLAGAWGSLQVDDEGIPARRNVLIDHGVLTGCLADRLDGRRLGIEPTGSARRESYRFAPVARMTNTFLLSGPDSPAQMVESVERGLYVQNIQAGSVSPVTGEFNFHTAGTYLIEHGKITCPVHDATLIGTGGGILQKVEMVGNDAEIGQGFCYADSGTVYIGAGQPTVKLSEMTVGGDQV